MTGKIILFALYIVIVSSLAVIVRRKPESQHQSWADPVKERELHDE